MFSSNGKAVAFMCSHLRVSQSSAHVLESCSLCDNVRADETLLLEGNITHLCGNLMSISCYKSPNLTPGSLSDFLSGLFLECCPEELYFLQRAKRVVICP